MNRTLLVLGLFLGALVTGLLMRFNVTIPMPTQEHFMQKEVGSPIGAAPIGPYDSGAQGWASTEAPVGSLPASSALEQNKLMFMADAKTDPSCCPSAFSTDTGCVCLSPKDQDLLGRRGGNK
jgi:hypothetical protein